MTTHFNYFFIFFFFLVSQPTTGLYPSEKTASTISQYTFSSPCLFDLFHSSLYPQFLKANLMVSLPWLKPSINSSYHARWNPQSSWGAQGPSGSVPTPFCSLISASLALPNTPELITSAVPLSLHNLFLRPWKPSRLSLLVLQSSISAVSPPLPSRTTAGFNALTLCIHGTLFSPLSALTTLNCNGAFACLSSQTWLWTQQQGPSSMHRGAWQATVRGSSKVKKMIEHNNTSLIPSVVPGRWWVWKGRCCYKIWRGTLRVRVPTGNMHVQGYWRKFNETVSKVCSGTRETQATAKHQGLAKLGHCYHRGSDWARQGTVPGS